MITMLFIVIYWSKTNTIPTTYLLLLSRNNSTSIFRETVIVPVLTGSLWTDFALFGATAPRIGHFDEVDSGVVVAQLRRRSLVVVCVDSIWRRALLERPDKRRWRGTRHFISAADKYTTNTNPSFSATLRFNSTCHRLKTYLLRQSFPDILL